MAPVKLPLTWTTTKWTRTCTLGNLIVGYLDWSEPNAINKNMPWQGWAMIFDRGFPDATKPVCTGWYWTPEAGQADIEELIYEALSDL